MLVVAGARVGLLARVGTVVIVLGALAIALEPYRRDRLLAFVDPWTQSGDGAYQVVQAMIAIGSGGVTGVGLGGSVQKVNYLPEAHTDMIFAVVGEELGLVGALFVISLFATFAWAGFTIALRATDRFSQLVAAGTTSLVAGQAVVNLCAVMGVMPLTGIPLPLISHGSSSRVATLFMVGVLLSISRESAAPAEVEVEEAPDVPREPAAPRQQAATPPRRRRVAAR
jgi:cell division protein FtsW